jgi:hypothetical protein
MTDMEIQEVIKVINKMRSDGIIQRYAIGGAVGATFYLEPTATLDVDIFMTFAPEGDGPLISLAPVYDYLKQRGCTSEGEYIVVCNTPVQFLPPGSPLVEEALDRAVDKDIEGISVRVFSAEHLAAIALQTGRAKDKARLVQFIEEGALDLKRFEEILVRHGLFEKWRLFQKRILGDQDEV